MVNKKKYKAFIFDMDGTLVDSKLDFARIRSEIGIPPGEDILKYLENVEDDDFIQNAFEIIHKHEKHGAMIATPFSDIDDFIKILNIEKIPTVILTRNTLEITKETLRKFSWKFNKILTRECAPIKPDPEGLFQICEELNIDIKDVIYIGDHSTDILTAKNAGCDSALFLNGKNDKFSGMATYTITEFKELL